MGTSGKIPENRLEKQDPRMKLLYASASPYSAKVRMAAAYAGIAIEPVAVKTDDNPASLIDANPLGKIPTLILDGGDTVYDSRAITQYLNRLSRNALFPRNLEKRTSAEVLESLADGLCDCLLSMVYERRRSEEKVDQIWLDKQWVKVVRVLDMLNANPPKLTSKITVGQIALRAALGYLALRFPGKWEKGRSRLVRWAARFDEKFPELKAFVPS